MLSFFKFGQNAALCTRTLEPAQSAVQGFVWFYFDFCHMPLFIPPLAALCRENPIIRSWHILYYIGQTKSSEYMNILENLYKYFCLKYLFFVLCLLLFHQLLNRGNLVFHELPEKLRVIVCEIFEAAAFYAAHIAIKQLKVLLVAVHGI